jgi:uncharacterized integral membrane protein
VRALVWLARAAVFFVLFAFALNNQHESTIRWFFGQSWKAPTVFIVLAAFAVGCAFGMLSMVPAWWKHRRIARRTLPAQPPTVAAPALPVGDEAGGRTGTEVATVDPRLVDVPRPVDALVTLDGR